MPKGVKMAKRKVRKLTKSEEHYITSFCLSKEIDAIALDLCLDPKDIKDFYNNIKSKPINKFDKPIDGVVSMTAAQSMKDDSTPHQDVGGEKFLERYKNCIYRGNP